MISLNNPLFTTVQDVNLLCQSYFTNVRLGYFGYMFLKPNGEYYGLLSDDKWTKYHLYDKGYPPSGLMNYHELDDEIVFPAMDTGSQLGWSDKIIQEAQEKFGFNKLMIILKKYDDHMEGFFFDINETNAYEIYLNQFDYFENFIHYFNDKGESLIKQCRENVITYNLDHLSSSVKNSDSDKNAQFDHPIPKRYLIKAGEKCEYLTRREYQVLECISHLPNAKVAAQSLKISPRTIETHLNNIKRKIGVHSQSQLSAIYFKNKINRV